MRHLAGALREQGHQVQYVTVANLLRSLGYSLQANVKTREGRQHPDRDLQFRRIDRTCRQALKDRQPIISIDCKKKELVGDFKNCHLPPGTSKWNRIEHRLFSYITMNWRGKPSSRWKR